MGRASTVEKAVIRADNRKLGGDLRKSKSMFRRTFGGIGKGIKGALSGALSPLGVGAGALGFAVIGKEVLDFEDSLNRIGIQANMTAAEIDTMRGDMIGLSGGLAMSRAEVANTATALINLTGDIKFTRDAMGVLGEANLATGASMEELAGLAFSLQKSFKLNDAAGLEKGLSAIITAGKQGAIPLGEMALILQQLSASFSDLGGTGVEGAADLAAALQVLRPAFGSAAEAGTGLQSMMTALKKKSAKLGKEGIAVFVKDAKTGGKVFRGLRAILDDIAKSDMINNPDLLVEVLGRVEAEKAMKAWTKGRDEFERLSEAAKNSNAIQEDAAKRRESSAFKITKAMNDAKAAIADTFTPARIEKFASLLGKLAETVAFMVEHAEAFVAVWAAFKIGSLVAGFVSIATSTAAIAASSEAAAVAQAAGGLSLKGSLGTLGKMGGVLGVGLAAGTVGYLISNEFEKKFNISGMLTGTKDKNWKFDAATENKQDTGFLRDSAGAFKNASARRRTQMVGSKFGVNLGDDGNSDILKRAHQVAFQARDKGLIGKDGAIDREAAFKAQTGFRASMFNNDGKTRDQVLDGQGAKELALAISQAMQIDAVRQDAKAKGLTVKIEVDERGMLKARAVEEQNARRSP